MSPNDRPEEDTGTAPRSLQERYPTFRPRGLNARLERWMYRGNRPNRLARVLNRLWAIGFARGLLHGRYVTLEVVGRRSGAMRSFAMVVADLAGDRYLVSMLGEGSNWVRNVDAAGGRAVLRQGGRAAVRLEAVGPAARAPIVRRYLAVAQGPRAFVPIDRDAPNEAFEEVARHIPVYRIVPDPTSGERGEPLVGAGQEIHRDDGAASAVRRDDRDRGSPVDRATGPAWPTGRRSAQASRPDRRMRPRGGRRRAGAEPPTAAEMETIAVPVSVRTSAPEVL